MDSANGKLHKVITMKESGNTIDNMVLEFSNIFSAHIKESFKIF